MATAKTEKTTIRALRVVARRDSFRRAGRRFGAEPVEIPLTELKKGERELLTADPMLVCNEVDVTVDAADQA
jgi:hypothetical protein